MKLTFHGALAVMRMVWLCPGAFCAFLLIFGLVPRVEAHRLSDACAWLTIRQDTAVLRLDIPLRDLDVVVPLDGNNDGSVTWAELQERSSAIQELVLRSVRLQAGRAELEPRFEDLQVADLAGETCASLLFRLGKVAASEELRMEYRLLFDIDPQHRGLLRLDREGSIGTYVFGPDHATAVFSPVTVAAPFLGWSYFVREGIHHIWIGADHILFLIALLLPAVIVKNPSSPSGSVEFRQAALMVLKVVTAFTLAHSLTLAVAVLGWVRLPSRWVETVIAASIVVAALNNLIPLFRDRGWWVAFGFGLIHGFGFAGVLAELELPAGALARGLVGFNAGVEIGQLAIVAAFLPVAYFLRDSWVYRRVVLQWGSACIIGISMIWVAQRAFGGT